MCLSVVHLAQVVQDMLAQRAKSMTALRLHGPRVDCHLCTRGSIRVSKECCQLPVETAARVQASHDAAEGN
jgi:hypothetical protein